MPAPCSYCGMPDSRYRETGAFKYGNSNPRLSLHYDCGSQYWLKELPRGWHRTKACERIELLTKRIKSVTSAWYEFCDTPEYLGEFGDTMDGLWDAVSQEGQAHER